MTEQGTRRCRLCDKEIAPGVSVCPSCGTAVETDSSAAPVQPSVPDKFVSEILDKKAPGESLPEIKSTCPFCAFQVDDTQTKCPRCGVALKVVIARPFNMLSCPECGALSPANSKTCIKCGVTFVNELLAGQAATPPKAAPPEIAPSKPMTPPVPVAEKSLEPSIEVAERITPVAPATTGGLTNGRGVTNGAATAHGIGAVNGTGIVNGTGVTNGIGASGARSTRPERTVPAVRRWQFLAVLVAVIIIIPLFVYIAYSRPAGLAVDGEFGDWNKAEMFGMQEIADSPAIAVQQWSVQQDGNSLYLYLSVEGTLMSSSNIDSFYLFVDSDNDKFTGYSISGMGANYMLTLDGWDGQVQSTSLMEYTSVLDKLNWNYWSTKGSLEVSMGSAELEAMATMPVVLEDQARFLLLTQSNTISNDYSVSYSVPKSGGLLVAWLEPGSAIDEGNGTVPSGLSENFATLVLTCEGVEGTITGISPSILDASLVSVFDEISLIPGEEMRIDIQLDTRLAPATNAVSVIIDQESFTTTFKEVSILEDTISAYAVSPPPVIEIDGAFGDWLGRLTPDDDSSVVQNPNVNVTATGYADMTSSAAFYVSVDGEVFQGSWIPTSKSKPTGGGGGGGGGVSPRASGEDLLRVYIDSDLSNSTGLTVARQGKIIGADYMIEMRGSNGDIVSKRIVKYDINGWIVMGGELTAAKDSQRLEFSVPIMSIGGNSTFSTIIETTDWKGKTDWAWVSSVPDPWVVSASGVTYQSDTGALWNYIGMPALVAGDYVVDIAMTSDDSYAVIVTNTGRTYYWEIAGTATNWTAGETIPIDTATYSNGVSMTFFSKTGAWLLTKNGTYFFLMNAITPPPSKAWTYQDVVTTGVTDFTDINYEGGTMYAMRSGANTPLNYSNNGNSFISATAPTGSTSNQSEFVYLSGGPGSSDDRIFVLCENGNLRYSANGGVTWSAWGNLPTPAGGNTSKYMGIGIDSNGYMWVVTDTGYVYRSADNSAYSTFNFTGQAPISGIVAVVPLPLIPAGIPEFQYMLVPVLGTVLIVLVRRLNQRSSENQ